MFSKKGKNIDVEGVLKNILNQPDLNVFAVRGKKCEVIFANQAARAHIGANSNSDNSESGLELSCELSFARNFQNLCDYCPFGRKSGKKTGAYFEIKDAQKRVYLANCNLVEWFDEEPAAVFFTRDITKEKDVNKKLYSLAFLDQLTEIPNRRKLQEDFNALEELIAGGMLSGVIALFDLDHFKIVNDTYGHNAGDMILRRLTEHLSANPAFAGKLYRLGGDEFVLLFSDAPDKFDSEQEMLKAYTEIISTALCSYTLPNIEVSCTLSIGVSAFPKHGTNLSEILRKADIAMYAAKTQGRNRISVFEEKHDVAQKFKDLFINLQPVLYATQSTFGYELIDRGDEKNNDGEDNTISLSGVNRAIDALGLEEIRNDMRYFISFSSRLLNPAVSKSLPRDKFIVQINLPEIITKSDAELYLNLRKTGYKLALVGLKESNMIKEVLALADFCKFDSKRVKLAEQKKIIKENLKIKFIATGIDTPEQYVMAKNAGFSLYQGYFFSHTAPDAHEHKRKTKDISPLKANYFRLLKLSSTSGYMDFNEISSIISSDVALTYKLLRILNSAAVGLRNVSSVSMAVAYLGEENLKQWIAVLALRGIAEDQPMELVRMSLIRARFGELLSPHFHVKQDPKKIFITGLLSLLHIAFEMSKAELLEEIPVSEEIHDSLLKKDGVYSDLLQFFEDYEYANWDSVSVFLNENKISATLANDSYIAATKWYDDLSEA
ncbi:MAG: diguanylate cyclase [Oscillospiraceae bacterium]|nr:diguanylate cyclase [Oscillospiraceae bacterium]